MNAIKSPGTLALVLAASVWGCFPLYWSFLHFTSTLDVLAHRVCWSLLVGIFVHRVTLGVLAPKVPSFRELVLTGLAASVLAFNWGISIYAVHVGRVVEGGIGMYFAPVLQMILGILLFGEQLTKTKAITVLLLLLSSAILILDLREIPYIALGMGGSFAIYATIKKSLTISGTSSFVIETAIMFLPAAVFLTLTDTAMGTSIPVNLFLIGAGLIAAPPLILYGFGVQRVTLATSGMILLLIPLINVLVGAVILQEPVSLAKMSSIAIIGAAVTYYTWMGLRHA